jgi:tetratricopeptide (TPR) repeat protein
MAAWGIAYASGPHINFPMVPEPRAKIAWEALQRARAGASRASAVERALIEALGARYAWPQPADRRPLDEAYAAAMREVARAFPTDADVGALAAEALMDLHPWDLWTDGKAQPWTGEIVALLEAVLRRAPDHPFANHLYIHAVEASPTPEKADAAAERLRTLQPGLGHMVHMPTHIDVRRGRWEQAIASNARAIEVDRQYRARRPAQGFYRVYMAHNHHMLTFAAMMTGRSELALRTIRDMVAQIPEKARRENAAFLDGFIGMPFEVLMRFGRWDEILAEPEPADYLPLARALRLYARAVALAAQDQLARARSEQKAFLAAKAAVPAGASFGNNRAADLLGVAEHLLAGEILFRDGQHDAAFAEMRAAVAREDALRYDEPPDWIQPVRHALGAALLRAGDPVEAEVVYREDLARLPGNVWSLVGLARSLRLQERAREAAEVERMLERAAAEADIPLTSSCLCLPGV